ncbi:hypothetical protein E2C01_028676 [Portunus trituberculatus]|uniref:Uncharacterized protein n=1 Tax=Portunus trituberculatus TaxID=210409 RepID=A0A5B7EPU7_PORTR|nr:hypothetical protein [Portunus trituberculatus]
MAWHIACATCDVPRHSGIGLARYLLMCDLPPRTAISVLRGRVDLTYEASEVDIYRYRAIRIMKPTTDIAGHYKCEVASNTVESNFPRDLVVFSEFSHCAGSGCYCNECY